jgi:hypothetical protein
MQAGLKVHGMTTTPHLSKLTGTAPSLLAAQYADCLNALDTLQQTLQAVEFNSRDYSADAFKTATAERSAIFQKTRDIENYLLAHFDAALDA